MDGRSEGSDGNQWQAGGASRNRRPGWTGGGAGHCHRSKSRRGARTTLLSPNTTFYGVLRRGGTWGKAGKIVFLPGNSIFLPAKMIFLAGKTIFLPVKMIFLPGKIIFPVAKIIFPAAETIFPAGQTAGTGKIWLALPSLSENLCVGQN